MRNLRFCCHSVHTVHVFENVHISFILQRLLHVYDKCFLSSRRVAMATFTFRVFLGVRVFDLFV